MGPQSQNRLTPKERTHQMQANSHKRKAGGQLTLFGTAAFNPNSDCEVCKAKLGGRNVHRSHHKLCTNDRNKKGMLSESTIKQMKIDEELKNHFSQPLALEEKASSRYLTKEAGDAFFAVRNPPKKAKNDSPTTTTTTSDKAVSAVHFLADNFCSAVAEKISNKKSVDACANSKEPLAMLAFAKVVEDKIINNKKIIFDFFHDLTLTVPPCKEMHDNPHYHSIVGQQLLLVDWIKLYGLDVKCPGCGMANLDNDRTHFSKNKLLFPTYGMQGPPAWCMVQSMTCPCCKG